MDSYIVNNVKAKQRFDVEAVDTDKSKFNVILDIRKKVYGIAPFVGES